MKGSGRKQLCLLMMCWFYRARQPAVFCPQALCRIRPRVYFIAVVSSAVVFRALLCEFHGMGPSHLLLLQRDGHGVSSSGEGFILFPVDFLSFCLCWTNLSLLAPSSGDGVPGGPRVQGRPGRLPASPGETVDHVPQSEAQLLCAG